ncbi:MAG: GAF domain-containing protein [Firmicutes bacterium]|nr:GAF domain-containing protein [Bacillota bacterium]
MVGNVTKEAQPDEILQFIDGLLEGESSGIAQLANMSATLWQYLREINWVGFYLAQSATSDMVLGPFQGPVACTRIAPGKGVIGAAVSQRRTIIVPDVREFPGHIACDSASRSEIVVPIRNSSAGIVAVLDVDAPVVDRFHPEDQAFLESVAERMQQAWPHWKWS